jgi:signal peptidase II
MRLAPACIVASLVALADQATKALVVRHIPYGDEIHILPGLFSLVHSRNRGVAFGMFGAAGPVAQTALLVVALGVLVFVAWQLARGVDGKIAWWGLALILGGAVGNIIDRVARGEVVDFLLAFVRIGGAEYRWPAFNVADSAITVGAGLVMLAEVLAYARSRRVPRPD